MTCESTSRSLRQLVSVGYRGVAYLSTRVLNINDYLP